ncbi:MAG: hypothetical protein V4850_21750 [Myxococcota bacterium]
MSPRTALLALVLAGCARGATVLSAPVELAPATRAWGVAVTDVLAPTALGAADETLCAWAKGEAPPANVTRWVAEGRLRFRVLVVDGPHARVPNGAASESLSAETLSAQVKALAAPEITLAERCGTPRPRGILVLADRDASYGAVADAVELARVDGGYLDAWLAVDAPVSEVRPPPGFQPGVPVVALVAPDGRVALSNREGRGYEGAPGALAAPLAAVGAPGKVGCATISGQPVLPWATALAAMEALRGEGVELQALDLEGAPGAAAEARATPPPRAERTWPLDTTIAAVPARTLSRCGDAPMGWWCDHLCLPEGEPQVVAAAPATDGRPLGELVYTAHRIVLVEGGRTEALYDDGVLPPPAAAAPFAPPCPGAERWLVFEAATESGVLVGAGRGALSSLAPSFPPTLAAVQDAVGWRRAIEAGTAPWDEVRAAAAGEGPRARLAWDALVNPAWHDGGVDAALRDADGRIRAAPPVPAAADLCDGAGAP